MYDTLWITFFLALILSFAISPLSIKLAPKVGAMDIPKDKRRMHKKAMPRFGGLAIFVGSTVSMLVFLSYDPKMVAITIGGVLIYILGIVDDIRGLSPAMKFLGELAVAIVMYVNDIRIEFITNFFGQGNSQLGDFLCFIVTVVWIVGITNTINLIDGLDGLAAALLMPLIYMEHMIRQELCWLLQEVRWDFCLSTFILPKASWETEDPFI